MMRISGHSQRLRAAWDALYAGAVTSKSPGDRVGVPGGCRSRTHGGRRGADNGYHPATALLRLHAFP